MDNLSEIKVLSLFFLFFAKQEIAGIFPVFTGY